MRIRHLLVSLAALLFIISLNSDWCLATDQAKLLGSAEKAIKKSMSQLGVEKAAKGCLLLTNAYYGQIKGKSAEAYRDLLSQITGCTTGKRSLLDVHTPYNESLWFSLFRKDSKKLIFTKWKDGAFQSQQIDPSPEKILHETAWKQASEGLIGKKCLFQVVSISLAWAEGAAWPVVKTAGFHDHLCPGVNIGYLAHKYLENKFPLAGSEKYVFFGALPKCYMDTLQVIYNTTLGKQLAYGVTMSKEQLAKYKIKGAVPSIIAIKVNKAKSTCQGIILGFSWKRIMDDLGIQLADFAPKGGPANPVFFLTRVKACWKMAQMKQEDKMKWLVEMRRFSGDASIASKICNAGGDPYSVVWAK